MQRAGGDSILILVIAADCGAEALDVEEGVLQLHWIEGPLDELDAAFEGLFALTELEAAADAGVVICGEHPQHVTVQVWMPSRFDAGNGKPKTDHFRAVGCAEVVST